MNTRKTRRALAAKFDPQWEQYLGGFYQHWRALSVDARERLKDLVRIIRADVHWEAVGGLELTEEMEVVTSGGAGLLILGFDIRSFPGLTSVVFHPDTVTRRVKRSLGGGIISEEHSTLSGEAMQHGPVMIAWPEAVREASQPEWGRQVILHELAHKLDMIGGSADGIPPIGEHVERANFASVLDDHQARMHAGELSALRSYAATNRAEMFAVATELFFTDPVTMVSEVPDLYTALAIFYRQDPALETGR